MRLRNSNTVRGLVGIIVIALGTVTIAQGHTGARKGKNLPPAVAKALQENRPGAEIDKLTIEKEHGISVYDFEFKNAQGEMDVTQDGTVLDIATIVAMSDIPDVVAATIRSEAKGRAIKQLERSEVRAEIVTEGGKSRVATLPTPKYVYEAEFSKGEIEVAADGSVIKKEK